MEIFSVLPVPGEFPAQRPVTRNFDVFFDLRPSKRLSKQWRGWWFETQSRSLWRHRNANDYLGWIRAGNGIAHTHNRFPCWIMLQLWLFSWGSVNAQRTGELVTGIINTLRPRQNGRHFADDTFKCIFCNENVCIPIKISLKFVPKGPVSNIPALVQIMAWLDFWRIYASPGLNKLTTRTAVYSCKIGL